MLKIQLPYDPAIPPLGIYPGKTTIQKDCHLNVVPHVQWCNPMLHPNVHCSTIYSSQDMEITK